MTNKDYQYMFESAVVTSEQLRRIGDQRSSSTSSTGRRWPAKALTSEGWNLATSGFAIQPFVGPYSYLKLFWGPAHVGRVAERSPSSTRRGRSSTPRSSRPTARTPGRQIQQRMADQVYILEARRPGLQARHDLKTLVGFKPYQGAHRFWDVWLE